MAAITATSYATPAAQAWQSRARVDQAQREADQAESRAKALRTQAEQAEQEADQGQARVGTARTQLAQTDSTYSSQVRQQQAAAQFKETQAALTPTPPAAPTPHKPPPYQGLKAASSLWARATQPSIQGRLLDLSV